MVGQHCGTQTQGWPALWHTNPRPASAVAHKPGVGQCCGAQTRGPAFPPCPRLQGPRFTSRSVWNPPSAQAILHSSIPGGGRILVLWIGGHQVRHRGRWRVPIEIHSLSWFLLSPQGCVLWGLLCVQSACREVSVRTEGTHAMGGRLLCVRGCHCTGLGGGSHPWSTSGHLTYTPLSGPLPSHVAFWGGVAAFCCVPLIFALT